MLPEDRPYKLSTPVRWICSVVGIAWAILTTVLFVFPPEIPVTPTNMNYCVAAFGVILLIAVVTWIVDGRKNYKGPLININQDGATLEGASMADTSCTSNVEDDLKGN